MPQRGPELVRWPSTTQPDRVPNQRYSAPAVLFHWMVAALIFVALILAWSFEDLPATPHKRMLVQLHVSFGMTVLPLAVLRFVWRTFHHPPPFPIVMPLWQRRLAGWVHVLLYAAIFLQPITGYMTAVTDGHTPEWFGVFPLPLLLEENSALHAIVRWLHVGAQWPLYGLLVMHIGAALYHHFVLRDDGILRMLPGSTRSR